MKGLLNRIDISFFFAFKINYFHISSCFSVAKSCPTLCNSLDYSTAGFPVFTVSWRLLKRLSFELMMPSNHLILCRPLLLISIFPSFKVFSIELAHHIRWPKNWHFSVSPSSGQQTLGLWPDGHVNSVRSVMTHLWLCPRWQVASLAKQRPFCTQRGVLLLIFSTDSQKLQWHLCGFPLGLPGIADPSVCLAGLQPLG